MEYRTRIITTLSEIGNNSWSELLAAHSESNPFLSYAFLDALHESGSANAATGWEPHYLTLWRKHSLAAAMPLYLKRHSYGEYVFDWAWADAYRQNGLRYYPKLLSAIPFTPVSGNRLLAMDADARRALIDALTQLQRDAGVSSTHVLFPPEPEATALQDAGFLLRSGVQFHWHNRDYRTFDDFLDTLDRKKRKNIKAERRKVHDAGIAFRRVSGRDATTADWMFFHRCYERTYQEHYSTPYLNQEFFLRIGETMPEHLLLVIAERNDEPIAASMLVHTDEILYGRYWGAIEDVPCLHFETAYYQPLEYCIEQKIKRFEGGAQGEHKMARGFLPHKTWSAHWLAHPDFYDAVQRYLTREKAGIDSYIDELQEHGPYRS